MGKKKHEWPWVPRTGEGSYQERLKRNGFGDTQGMHVPHIIAASNGYESVRSCSETVSLDYYRRTGWYLHSPALTRYLTE